MGGFEVGWEEGSSGMGVDESEQVIPMWSSFRASEIGLRGEDRFPTPFETL